MPRAYCTHSREMLLLLFPRPSPLAAETGTCPWGGRGAPFPKRAGRLEILHVCFTGEHRSYFKASRKGGIFLLDEGWELWLVWRAQVSVSYTSETSWRSEIKRCILTFIEVCVAASNEKKKSSGTFPGSTQRASGLSQIRIRPLPLTIRLHHILLFATV